MKARLFTLLLLCFSPMLWSQLLQKSYALTNVNVFNGVDNRIISGSIIYVKAGKIKSSCRRLPGPAGWGGL